MKRRDYRNSIIDGMFASVYGTLTGGVFLTGFALYLGMNNFLIGLLTAIPFMVTLFQLPASYYIRKNGKTKRIAFITAAIARLFWIPIVIAALWPGLGAPVKCLLVLMLLFLSSAFSSISYVAWLSWTSDLVPDDIRGSFFGTRNMLCGAAGIAAVLVFGNLVDFFKEQMDRFPEAIGFTFLIAVVFGLLSAYFLNRVGEPQTPASTGKPTMGEMALPFREVNFRRFLCFSFFWNFSVYFASPFFTLYFLRDLGFSYRFVALLTAACTIASLVGMQAWGWISDRVKNRAIIQFGGWFVVFLPALWTFVRPGDYLLPILLQLTSGGFWAGVNLCTHNLLLRLSPRESKVWYLSAHNITVGLGAAAAPILAGLFLSLLENGRPNFLPDGLIPMHLVFYASTLMRLASLQYFRYVHEPQETSVRTMIALFGRGWIRRLSAVGILFKRE